MAPVFHGQFAGMHWQTSRFSVDLNRPQVMGIVNVTPDSFSDGGRWASTSSALAQCEQLLKDGAHMLDLGAESTRPGATPVPLDEELQRLLPVLREACKLGVPVSVDTYKPGVMRAVLDEGADIVNDIWALRQPATDDCPSALDVVSAHPSCGVCLMHMHRDPQTMQVAPMEGDVVPQVLSFLELLTQRLRGLGVDSTRICLDPGIGFGKTVQQNFALLARQAQVVPAGYPVLAGWSRKSSLAAVTQTSLSNAASMDVDQRRAPSITAAVLAVQNGANVVRVHDVRDTVAALKVLAAMQAEQEPPRSAAARVAAPQGGAF
jgi:dihydropteroate synthase